MNLNKFDRQAFVKAVMDDVPQVDYSEIARKIAAEYVASQTPAELLPLMKKYPQYFETNSIYFAGECFSFRLPNYIYVSRLGESHPMYQKDKELSDKKLNQDRERLALESKLESMIAACRTLKQAKELLPSELHKYLPADREGGKVANLPMVVDVVTDLRAAGWPDLKKAA